MLTTAMVHEIDHLLKEGRLSQRQIAARLGISRGTVGAIAIGRRGLFGKEPAAEPGQPSASPSPPVRCPHCGHRVYAPCLICQARKYRGRRILATQLNARPNAGTLGSSS